MATATVNAIAILNAIVDGTATTAQRQRALAAFSVGLDEPTPEEVAARMVRDVRAFLLNRVRSVESQIAATAIESDFTV